MERPQLQAQIAALLNRQHRNLRRIWVAIGIATVCSTGMLVTMFWGWPGGLRAGVGYGGLAVVAAIASWFILRLGKENERMEAEIKKLGRKLREGD